MINQLLSDSEPAVRYLTLTEVLGYAPTSARARAEKRRLGQGAWVRALLSGQRKDGGFGTHPYAKWQGAHWRLVSLVELGVSGGASPEARAARAAAQTVLDWLHSDDHRCRIKALDGRVRRCASQEGNALAVCCRLGLARNPRVRALAESLVAWQWPDGGWNCDRHPEAAHSSFYESLAPLWGLIEYHRATGDEASRAAAERAAELFLRHRLFRSDCTGQVINPEWLKLHYPIYWHYDILQALLILSRLGPLTDPRLDEALDCLEAKQQPGGGWRTQASYWRPPGSAGSNVEIVDWRRPGPHPMLTLNALRVLRAAGRLELPNVEVHHQGTKTRR